jgi:hypothetical protein
MNAGMFGIGDGRGMAGRTLLGIAGKSTTPNNATQGNPSNVAGLLGATVNPYSLANNVRTKLLTINGAGVLKYLYVSDNSASPYNYVIEIWMDGAKVIQSGWTNGGSGNFGPVILGFVNVGAYPSVQLEQLPFYSSLEVYATTNNGPCSGNFVYLADLYQ